MFIFNKIITYLNKLFKIKGYLNIINIFLNNIEFKNYVFVIRNIFNIIS